MKPNKFPPIIIFYAILIGLFHFLRLSFNWPIIIGEWEVPTLVSGFIIVIAAFVIYWAFSIIKNEDEQSNKEKSEKNSF